MPSPTTAPARGIIARVTSAAIRRAGLFLGAAVLVTVASVWLASGLEIRSSFEELLPTDIPSVAHIKELVRRVGGDGTVMVNIESFGGDGDLRAAKSLAKVLAGEFLALGKDQIRAVDWNVAQVRDWYAEHWPLFVPPDELTKARDLLRAEIRHRKAEANPLAVNLDDDEEAPKPAGPAADWLDPKKPLPREKVLEEFRRYEDGFYVHPDRRSLTLVVRPTGTSLGVHEARALVDRMQRIVDAHGAELRANGLRVGFGGTFPLFIAEYEGIIQDVASTALLVVSLVVLSILLFFRDIRSTLSLAVAILVAVAATFGITRLVIGYLNTQTAFLGAIVVGNGINYGLIYLARVRQLRCQGVALQSACVEAALTTARATLLASAATSVSFGVLLIAGNRGFRHFGFIGGIGMLLCWVATFTLVPAMLTAWEKLRGAPGRAPRPETVGRQLVPLFERVLARPRTVAFGFAVLTMAAALAFLRQLPTAMERNLDNLSNEIKGQAQLLRDHDRANTSLGVSTAGAIALLDSRDEAERFCEVIRQRMKIPPNDRLIERCDTLDRVVPNEQKGKLAVLRDIEAELRDPALARLPPEQRARVAEVRREIAAQGPLTTAEAPPTLLDKFRERDGTLGRLASITARPDAKLELAPNLEAFVRSIREVPVDGKRYDATGENVIVADLLENIEREGPRTTLLSFAGVCLLVLFFFRNFRTSLEVMGSLFIGVLLMSGVAALIGLKINFFNFIVFPITFGIAVDYGANVAARVREREGDVLGSLAEVGPAVALCSWTSIIGYGSLLFSLNRALRSFGWYAMVGEVTTIITALVLLPALLLLARRQPIARPTAQETS